MSSSGYNNTPRRTATIELDFTAGQYPSFKMNCGVFGGSNNVKINYDIGNNGTVYSYYQAWFI